VATEGVKCDLLIIGAGAIGLSIGVAYLGVNPGKSCSHRQGESMRRTCKWKQIGVNEITDSRELPFFIQWLTADHPSQDGKAVAAIEKITIADTDHLSDSWFKTEILGELNGADVEFIDPSANDGEYGIVAVQLTTPTGSVVLD
jgi:hypothetical protein